MPKRVAAVGRTGGDPDGDESGDRRHDVDDALEGVGIKGDAAGAKVGEKLDAGHDGGDHDARDGETGDVLFVGWHGRRFEAGTRAGRATFTAGLS
jgi:hypothetical protein